MNSSTLHSWNVSYTEALEIQRQLRSRVVLEDGFRKIRTIAGCDMAIDVETDRGVGGVIVYSFPGLEEIERKWAVRKLEFPYIPGLLSFREAPVLLDVLDKLETQPDLIMFDGHGIAHPRGVGIAAHMGLLLDKPAIGCAKSRLCGRYSEPPAAKGSRSLLKDAGGKILGTVLRTRENVKPVFVSPGHRVSFETAVRIVESCVDGYRIPKPTREADRFVAAVKREELKHP